MDPRQGLGRTGEELAAASLTDAGYHILQRNWRCPVGEIDIIAHTSAPDYSQGGVLATWLVIVEVRTRRGFRFGTAIQAVTAQKQSKLCQVAKYYVQDVKWQGPWRIDVVAVQMDEQGHLVSIEHIQNAVTA